MKIKLNNRETLKIRLYSYYVKYLRKKFTIEHLISEGEKRTTIYDMINRFESGKNAKREETSCLDRYVTPWGFRAIHHGQLSTETTV